LSLSQLCCCLSVFLGYNAQSVGSRNTNSRRNVLSSKGGNPIIPCNSSISWNNCIFETTEALSSRLQ